MPIPENFKYDVRVRERMLKRGSFDRERTGQARRRVWLT